MTNQQTLTAGQSERSESGPAPQSTSGGRIRLGLIFGGANSEHGVSCLGAAAVAAAIDPARYDVIGIGISKDRRWHRVSADEFEQLQIIDGRLPELSGAGPELMLRAGTDGPVLTDGHHDQELDVAMIMMHGPGAEDGAIQGWCESVGLRYTGSGVAASAVGLDKFLMKLLLAAAGVSVGPYEAITDQQWTADADAALARVSGLSFPVFVKPARAGSSQGISRVSNPSDLRAAIEFAREHDPKIVVEQGFVGARELECGVFQGADGPEVSVIGEIVMRGKDGFYDYASKYTPGDEVSVVVPAAVSPEVDQRMRELAVEVFTTLGCEGHARVDCFLTADQEVVINEINTLPGFTATSMFPKVWEASGVSFAEQIDRLVELALARGIELR